MAKKPPSAVLATPKSPSEFRDCVVLGQSFSAFTVSDYEGGYMFVHTKAVGQVITVKPAAGGSDVTVWGLLGTRRVARACI